MWRQQSNKFTKSTRMHTGTSTHVSKVVSPLKTSPFLSVQVSLSRSAPFACSLFEFMWPVDVVPYHVSNWNYSSPAAAAVYTPMMYKWESHWCYKWNEMKKKFFVHAYMVCLCVFIYFLLAQAAFETVCINLYLSILINSNYNCVNNSVNAHTLTYIQMLVGSRWTTTK